MTYVDWLLLIVFVPPLGELAGWYWREMVLDIVFEVKACVRRFRRPHDNGEG